MRKTSNAYQIAHAANAAFLTVLLWTVQANAMPISPTAEDAASRAAGRALVERNCGMCHATGREGSSPNPQAPAFRDLHNRYDVENLAEALAEGILTGHPAMPEFRFEPNEVNSIILYLKSIQTEQHAIVRSREPDSY